MFLVEEFPTYVAFGCVSLDAIIIKKLNKSHKSQGPFRIIKEVRCHE